MPFQKCFKSLFSVFLLIFTLIPAKPMVSPLSAVTAGYPFYDGFESGVLGADWSIYVTSQGRVQVGTTYPYAGSYSLLLDDSVYDAIYSTAAAILTIDLSGQTQVDLDFWWRKILDEDHATDGVFISADDGATWYQALSFNADPTGWRHQVIDLDQAAAANGLSFNNHFQIKFQFYDDDPIPNDGYAIDEVRVRPAPSPIPAAFPFYDGFESGNLGLAWMVDFIDEGRVRVTSNYPYAGSYGLLLDDWENDAIYSTASAILTINLSGMSQVKLDFWWKEFVDENHATDGVFIRDDVSTGWVKILSFNDGPSDWRHETIELDDPVTQNSLVYTDHFQIMFQFYDDDPIPNDGYAIDEVYVRPNAAPQLSWIGTGNYEQDGLHPEQGDTYNTYTYSIQYSDQDGDTPGAVETHIKKAGLEVSGSPFLMSCGSGDTSIGVTCSYAKADFGAGSDYSYFFSAKDDHGNASISTVELNGPLVFTGYRLYLSALMWDVGLPGIPVLDPISNPGGSYQYTVQWSPADRASSYTLEEDEDPNFASPTAVYVGANPSAVISAPDVGTYSYRVKASNDFGSSDWSNIQSVAVSVPPPPCPQTGLWSAAGNHFSLDYRVGWDGNTCSMYGAQGHLGAYCWAPGLGGWWFYVEFILLETTIDNNHFATHSSNEQTDVSGDFTSFTAADGSWSFNFWDPVNNSTCTGSGSWTASPAP